MVVKPTVYQAYHDIRAFVDNLDHLFYDPQEAFEYSEDGNET